MTATVTAPKVASVRICQPVARTTVSRRPRSGLLSVLLRALSAFAA